jgi:FkbM family methyltransferase
MVGAALRSWRENYYLSKLLTFVASPAYSTAKFLSSQIPRKIKNNGAIIALPNGRSLRFAKDSGIGIGSSVYWLGLDGYEPATARTLRSFFPKVTTFVDVGANCGLYSLLAALTNPKIHVFAFEPEPGIYRNLSENVKLNGLGSQISTFQTALSDQTGKAEFYLPPATGREKETTGTIAENSWQARKEHTTLSVDTLRLDDFNSPELRRVELIKIDVEDAEAKVLCGMTTTILRDKPLIVCEILPRAHRNERTLQIIQELGYTPYWITSAGYIRVGSFDFERGESQDFLLSPRQARNEIVQNPVDFLPL